MIHRRLGAVPFDFENTALGRRRRAFQGIVLAKRFQLDLRLGEILIVDFRLDAGQHLVLQDLELEVLHGIFGLSDLAVVFDARRFLFRLFLNDLIDEIVVLGPLVEGDLFL